MYQGLSAPQPAGRGAGGGRDGAGGSEARFRMYQLSKAVALQCRIAIRRRFAQYQLEDICWDNLFAASRNKKKNKNKKKRKQKY
ncbi:hypothetical protein EVAR_76705_1 [Eumeta japonica]|uniref:Uncharacterized protein n=1 Tax=Eumeta variegata TaxID=151549 RepID=A0A4C1SW31_EUMVA|nr:hypothetical protein EVAR_76705_1 [Eumeta japonica]